MKSFKKGDAAESFISVQPFKASVRSDEVVHKIQNILRECNHEHNICKRPKDYPLPSRVIDVGSSTPRLHISEPDQRAEYVTLSYCWGGPQEYTTTRGTIKDRIQAIPL